MVDESTATREGLDPFTSEPRLPSFSYGAVLEQSWITLKRDYLVLLGASVIYVLVKGIVGVVKQMLGMRSSDELELTFNAIDVLLLDPPFALGVVYIALLSIRLRRPGLDKVFSGFRCYLTIVGITLVSFPSWFLPPALVIGVLTGLGAAVGALLGDAGAGAVGGVILSAVPAFFLMLTLMVRLGPARLIALDPLHDASGVIECLRASWKLTDGSTLPLIALALTAVALFLGSGLACCLPALLFGLPFLFITSAVAYEMLRRDAEASELP